MQQWVSNASFGLYYISSCLTVSSLLNMLVGRKVIVLSMLSVLWYSSMSLIWIKESCFTLMSILVFYSYVNIGVLLLCQYWCFTLTSILVFYSYVNIGVFLLWQYWCFTLPCQYWCFTLPCQYWCFFYSSFITQMHRKYLRVYFFHTYVCTADTDEHHINCWW